MDLRYLSDKIQELDQLAQELLQSSESFPAINRNCKRILASVKMLKINTEGFEFDQKG
jgi:hypothetical protein